VSPAPQITLKGAVEIDGNPLFAPIDLHVPAGQWTCLLGASGVGKTTLLRLIAGLEDVATLRGHISAADAQPLAPRVALMAQSDLLMPWLNVTENILLGARLRGGKAAAADVKRLAH